MTRSKFHCLSWLTASLFAFFSTNALAFSLHWQLLSRRTPSTSTLSSTIDSSLNINDNKDLWNNLLSRFQGDFDNYHQVLEDRNEGLFPKEGGGHEHIHCTLVTVAENTRLAAFYFDGIPNAIFRFRFYHLQPVYDSQILTAVETTLYTLNPELEAQLRSKSTEPLAWSDTFQNYFEANRESSIVLLPNCEVRWSWEMDPVQHAYAVSYTQTKEDAGIHAVMVQGQAIVDSQMSPGTKILIKDQLSLWPDELWIHDRGYDPNDLNKLIYGNQRGIPYRLDRVTRIRNEQRVVTSETLQWTLGPSFRTDAVYRER